MQRICLAPTSAIQFIVHIIDRKTQTPAPVLTIIIGVTIQPRSELESESLNVCWSLRIASAAAIHGNANAARRSRSNAVVDVDVSL